MNKHKEKIDNFINIKFNSKNLPIYYVRKSIFSALKNNTQQFKGKLLDIGCGKMPYRDYIIKNTEISDYIGLDIENAITYSEDVRPDITWDGQKLPFPNESFDCILATELLEHCPNPETIFSEAYRVLRQNGTIFLTTPFVFPLHESPHDEYRYTPYCIERLANMTGFKHVKIYSLGGINAVLSQILAIYPLNKYLKKIILQPIVYILIKLDIKRNQFRDGSIYTGLCAIIKK